MAAEGTWSRLLPSAPLGWLQLWHKPLRLTVAVAGIAFAVLLINIAAPLIDMHTQPPVFGHKGKREDSR
mgnify:CR=1 FL=1